MGKVNNMVKISNKVIKALSILGIFLLVGIIIGLSFAYWSYTATQTSRNTITSDCLEISLANVNDAISIEKGYPISDSEASNLTPYTFKITNKCNTVTSYNINLEIMGQSSWTTSLNNTVSTLDPSYVAISLDNGTKRILSSHTSVNAIYSGSDYKGTKAYNIGFGVLESKESISHDLRVWMDGDVTSANAMNKSFLSKISIVAAVAQDNLSTLAKVGDYVEMTPTSTYYQIPSTLTGYSSTQTINPSELKLWRIININSDGSIDMVSEYTSSTAVYFQGKKGYMNLVGGLNTIARQYQNSNYTIGARHMGYNGQTEYLTNTSKFTHPAPWTSPTRDNSNEAVGGGDVLYTRDINLVKNALGTLSAYRVNTTTSSYYFLASRYYDVYWSDYNYYIWAPSYVCGTTVCHGDDVNNLLQYIYSGGELMITDNSYNKYIRPIVTLKPGLTATGSGTSSSHWVLK